MTHKIIKTNCTIIDCPIVYIQLLLNNNFLMSLLVKFLHLFIFILVSLQYDQNYDFF